MMYEQEIVHTLYRKLLALYPQTFKEQLGESMERTFQDLWNEKRQTKQELFGIVLWTFIETAIGIFREHLLLISPGDVMRTILKFLGSSALISFLLILPFMIMEVVNRRNFNEDFPTFLFFVMWLNLFAVSVILLPIVLGRQTRKQDMENAIPTQGNTLLTKPGSAAIVSVIVFLSPGILPLLDSVGWLSTDRLFNGPNPEVAYLPGMFMSLGLILFPIAAGIIAGRPIVNTLRAGGSLFAHPINLIIVVFISSTFAIGFASFIIDQWPCFIGVPNCD
jgi:hypothetical protein